MGWNTFYNYKIFSLKNMILGFIISLFALMAMVRIENHHISNGGLGMALIALISLIWLVFRNIKGTSTLIGLLILPIQLIGSFIAVGLALCAVGRLEQYLKRRF